MINGNMEQFDYYFLLSRALSRVPNTIDKRQGSVIYDAIAPCCYELAEAYLELSRFLNESFFDTATGEFLDRRCAEAGVFRRGATRALCRALFADIQGAEPVIPAGVRFSLESGGVTYAVTDRRGESGEYLLECEQEGSAGNNDAGRLFQLDYVAGLARAELLGIEEAASDRETDDELRARYMDIVTGRPFGGNISQYRSWLLERPEVGAAQIYPAWNGGGTVKCSVLSKALEPLAAADILAVQEAIDPPAGAGNGRGAAPIGHRVTIVTPQEKAVNISCGVGLAGGVTLSQATPLVREAVEGLFLEIRKNWGRENGQYASGVYVSRVNAAILGAGGILNIAGTSLNGAESDISLAQNEILQEIPVLGGLIISEI